MKKLVKRIVAMVLALSMMMVPVTPTEAAAKKRNTPIWKQEDIAYNFTVKWLPKTAYNLATSNYYIKDLNKDGNIDLFWAYDVGQYMAIKAFTYRRGRGMVRSTTKPIAGLLGAKFDNKRKAIMCFGTQNGLYQGLGYRTTFYYVYKFKGTQFKRTERWEERQFENGRVRYYKNGKGVQEYRYRAAEYRYEAL